MRTCSGRAGAGRLVDLHVEVPLHEWFCPLEWRPHESALAGWEYSGHFQPNGRARRDLTRRWPSVEGADLQGVQGALLVDRGELPWPDWDRGRGGCQRDGEGTWCGFRDRNLALLWNGRSHDGGEDPRVGKLDPNGVSLNCEPWVGWCGCDQAADRDLRASEPGRDVPEGVTRRFDRWSVVIRCPSCLVGCSGRRLGRRCRRTAAWVTGGGAAERHDGTDCQYRGRQRGGEPGSDRARAGRGGPAPLARCRGQWPVSLLRRHRVLAPQRLSR